VKCIHSIDTRFCACRFSPTAGRLAWEDGLTGYTSHYGSLLVATSPSSALGILDSCSTSAGIEVSIPVSLPAWLFAGSVKDLPRYSRISGTAASASASIEPGSSSIDVDSAMAAKRFATVTVNFLTIFTAGTAGTGSVTCATPVL